MGGVLYCHLEGVAATRLIGNLTGLKPSIRQRLENLCRRKVPPYQVISPELARDLAHLSFESARQLGLLIGRDGAVEMVIVGGPRSLYIPDLPKRAAAGGVCEGFAWCTRTFSPNLSRRKT